VSALTAMTLILNPNIQVYWMAQASQIYHHLPAQT